MLRSLLLATLLASTASAQAVHDTGALRLGVSNDGSVGAEAGAGAAPLVFQGRGLLFDGHFLVGTGPDRLSGRAYGAAIGPADWTPGNLVVSVPSGPNVQTFQASFFDAAAPNPLQVAVTQTSRSFSSPGRDRFVALSYEIRNGSAATLSGVYAGLFADFDVSSTGQDQAGFDAARQLGYTFSGSTYAGQILLGATPLSGWTVEIVPGFPGDAALFRLMTTLGQVPQGSNDRATLLGTGPFTIPVGGAVLVQFALVAGASLADLRASADEARRLFTADEDGPQAASGVSLRPAQPNPATGRTTLTFSLDAPQTVRLVLTDVLGREVAVLAEGPQVAGAHTATLDTSRLPAGVYVARLTAGAATATQRVTVVR